MKASYHAGDLSLIVMLRMLRCRFWKSELSRGPPGPSPSSSCGGVSILMTLAPQSASWRTQVGPDRTRVRSRTVKRSSAREAFGNGTNPLRNVAAARRRRPGRRRLFPDLAAVVHRDHGIRRPRIKDGKTAQFLPQSGARRGDNGGRLRYAPARESLKEDRIPLAARGRERARLREILMRKSLLTEGGP